MDIKKQAYKGVKWTSISTIILALSALLKISILTRFLEPSDFGLMALITFLLGFMDLFMDMGFSSAILHKQEIKKEEYSSLYWMNVFCSLLLFLIICYSSSFIAEFYNEPRLNELIPLSAVVVVFSAVGRQFKTILQKELRFKLMAGIDVTSVIIALVVAIILAIKGLGVESLIYSAIIQYAINNGLYFFLGFRHNPVSIHYSYNETKPFLKIGLYQVGSQMINYFNRDLDVLIIGRFFGAEILGGYSLAKQLVYRPVQILNPIVTKVASPILASIQNDLKCLKQNYLKLVNIVVSLNLPIYCILVIFAPFIVSVLYGDDFVHISILVRILSIYTFLRVIGNPVGSLVIATGKTNLEFYWNLLNFIILPISIIIGAQYSIEIVALSISSVMILMFIPSWFFLINKLTKATLLEYLKALIPNLKIIKDFKGIRI